MSNLYDLMAKLKAIEESAAHTETETGNPPAIDAHIGEGGDKGEGEGSDNNYRRVAEYVEHYMFANQIDALGSEDVDAIATELELPMEEVLDYLYDLGLDPQDPQDGELDEESAPVEECPQDGNVQLSMADLVKLIHHLQQGGNPSHDQALFGDEEEVGEEFANAQAGASDQQVAQLGAVTPTGDDMFSKGDEAEKVNGGGNPLQAHLSELYAQIKERQVSELSKNTLSSYAKKATDDATYHSFVAGGKHPTDPTRLSSDKKAMGRQAGVIKAIDRLAKEGATLKEANQMVRKLRK